MKVKVLYYAAMRDFTGKTQEVFDTQATTVQQLLQTLRDKYDILIKDDDMRVAVNEKYVDFSQPLKEEDTVVFIPPVAGG